MTAPGFGAALAALDGLIAVELQRLRARYALSLDEFRGLYVSDAMVDALLAERLGHGTERGGIPEALVAPIAEIAVRLGLPRVGGAMLMLTLAPELDARYPTLYAYLNDDVTRRWPTLDLALRLLVPSDDRASAAELRALLSDGVGSGAGLVETGLLEPAEPADPPRPLLLRGWRPSPVLVHHLLGLPGLPLPGLSWLPPPAGNGEAKGPAPAGRGDDRMTALLVTGTAGSGRRGEAALWANRQGRRALLYRPPEGDDRTRDAGLAARLADAVLVLDCDALPRPTAVPAPPGLPLAVLARHPEGWATALAPRIVHHRPQTLPNATARAALWRSALTELGLEAPDEAFAAVADRFALAPGAITRAARRLLIADDGSVVETPLLAAAARAESTAALDSLAKPVATTAGWDDLVLPEGTLGQLRDFAAAIGSRSAVFERWGFGAVGLGSATGLVALFGGGSGTGKTMSAAIIAAGCGLDLWRIDLSGMVSKYIGETEKNLERLFSASGAGNAILFFDEADALFGRRSEVKDSHDRYANIEIAYLLQRIEDHDGVVILATNLSRNLDPAFLRRLSFVIDFPMPDAAARGRLWRKAIPEEAPLARDVDFGELGRRFELSGGDIRTAALEAAFLAMARRTSIDRPALDTAIRRQLMKRGQLPEPAPERRHRTEPRATGLQSDASWTSNGQAGAAKSGDSLRAAT